MARDHARIKVSIWNDQDWRTLPSRAQWLYQAALSQPLLSYCGVVTYTPEAFADLAVGVTARHVRVAARTLSDRHYILTDPKTAEMWCRTFVRHDGLLKQPNVVLAAADAFRTIRSTEIRRSFVEEIRRLTALPELDERERAGARQLLHRVDPEGPQEPLQEPFPEPQDEPLLEPQGEPTLARVARTPSPTPSPTPSLGYVPDATPSANGNNTGGDHPTDEEFTRAVTRAVARTGKAPEAWTLANCRRAATAAVKAGTLRTGEDPRQMLIALAADTKTGLPHALATDAAANRARAILADQRRSAGNQRTETKTRQEAATAEQRAFADSDRRQRQYRQQVDGLPALERLQLVDEARELAAARLGIHKAPTAIVEQTALELLEQRKVAAS